MRTFVILAMLFCHVFDDYCLQGVLASMKQRGWWEQNAPERMYRHDYIVALIMHAISWSFMIMLPIAVYYRFQINEFFVYGFVTNVIVHAVIDDWKANKKWINLVVDQMAHLGQIAVTAFALL